MVEKLRENREVKYLLMGPIVRNVSRSYLTNASLNSLPFCSSNETTIKYLLKAKEFLIIIQFILFYYNYKSQDIYRGLAPSFHSLATLTHSSG